MCSVGIDFKGNADLPGPTTVWRHINHIQAEGRGGRGLIKWYTTLEVAAFKAVLGDPSHSVGLAVTSLHHDVTVVFSGGGLLRGSR